MYIKTDTIWEFNRVCINKKFMSKKDKKFYFESLFLFSITTHSDSMHTSAINSCFPLSLFNIHFSRIIFHVTTRFCDVTSVSSLTCAARRPLRPTRVWRLILYPNDWWPPHSFSYFCYIRESNSVDYVLFACIVVNWFMWYCLVV